MTDPDPRLSDAERELVSYFEEFVERQERLVAQTDAEILADAQAALEVALKREIQEDIERPGRIRRSLRAMGSAPSRARSKVKGMREHRASSDAHEQDIDLSPPETTAADMSAPFEDVSPGEETDTAAEDKTT